MENLEVIVDNFSVGLVGNITTKTEDVYKIPKQQAENKISKDDRPKCWCGSGLYRWACSCH
jgi:hypothetical protein